MVEKDFPGGGRPCDLLAAYEMGLIEPPERLAFEQHLTACPDCLDEIYAMAPASVAMQTDPQRYARACAAGLAAARPGPVARLRAGLVSLMRPRVLAPVALAAASALAVIVPQLQDRSLDRSPWQQLAVVEPLPYARIEVRAGADEPVRLFHQGMDLYLQADYGQAAAKLAEAEALQDRWPADAAALPAGLHDQTRSTGSEPPARGQGRRRGGPLGRRVGIPAAATGGSGPLVSGPGLPAEPISPDRPGRPWPSWPPVRCTGCGPGPSSILLRKINSLYNNYLC